MNEIIRTDTYIEYPDRETWLANRKKSLGASEIGIVCGYSTFATPAELWEEKTGKKKPKDLSESDVVAYGTEAEEHIRALFALKKKNQYKVEYHPFRQYFCKDKPFMTATLDGELTDLETGERGIWECKTVLVTSKATLDQWQHQIPMKYYCQLLQQAVVTGFDFAVLTAEFRFPDGNSETKNYDISFSDEQTRSDMEYITDEAVKFWRQVESGKKPATKMTL